MDLLVAIFLDIVIPWLFGPLVDWARRLLWVGEVPRL